MSPIAHPADHALTGFAREALRLLLAVMPLGLCLLLYISQD